MDLNPLVSIVTPNSLSFDVFVTIDSISLVATMSLLLHRQQLFVKLILILQHITSTGEAMAFTT